MAFTHENTGILVPTPNCCFEDDDAVYLVMENVEGMSMADLEISSVISYRRHWSSIFEPCEGSVLRNWEDHIVILLYQATRQTIKDHWNPNRPDTESFVFCHNNLSQHNVRLNPRL